MLKQLDAGSTATELGRKHGVHPNTIRLWRDKYAGMETSDLARLKQLESENAQMKRIIARQAIEIDARTAAAVDRFWPKTARLPSHCSCSAYIAVGHGGCMTGAVVLTRTFVNAMGTKSPFDATTAYVGMGPTTLRVT